MVDNKYQHILCGDNGDEDTNFDEIAANFNRELPRFTGRTKHFARSDWKLNREPARELVGAVTMIYKLISLKPADMK